MSRRGWMVWLWLSVLSSLAWAATPEQEARIQSMSEVLRCLVCQNQSVAESSAGLAQDLKQQIREQIEAGRTDQEVVDYMVARYGDFVLYEPPVKPVTWLLWFGPLLLLLLAGWGFWRWSRRLPKIAPVADDEDGL